MIHNRKIVTILVAALLTGVIVSTITQGYANGSDEDCEPKIYIQPREISVSPGESFNIDIIADSCNMGIKTASFQLTYPTDFTIESFTYENLLGTSVLQMGTPSPGDNSGSINYAVARTDGGADPANGKLVNIGFRAGPPGMYQICIEEGLLIGSGNNPVYTPRVCANITVEEICCTCICGDCNCDCKIDILDLDALASAWGSSMGDDRYRECVDCDGDGSIGVIDLDIFAGNWGKTYCDCEDCCAPWCECESCPPICYCRKGDYNQDCIIDAIDMTCFSAAYGCCIGDSCYTECFDFNDDGCVDEDDLSIITLLSGETYCDCCPCIGPWQPWS